MQETIHNPKIETTLANPFWSFLNPFTQSKPVVNPTENYRILAFNWRCIKHPQSGGSEINLFRQAEHWVEMGNHVTVFTAYPGNKSGIEHFENYNGIHVLRYGGRFTLYIFALLYALFFSWQYDLILDISNGIPFFIPLVTRKPVTLMIHHVHAEQWQEEFSPTVGKIGWFLESRLVPFLYRKKQVITVSPTTEEEMLKIGYKPEHISIVYNGIDNAIPPFRHRREIPQVTYVGRVKAYKRIDKLVQAVWVLRQEFPQIKLDIAGTGDYSEELRELITKYGMKDCVTLHGYISEEAKEDLLSRTSVFVNPSMQEGWGISIIEANAYGCPAVAYDVPGLSASIPNNETGLLAKDDDDFIECIARILRDEDLMERLSLGAVFWATLFDWRASALSTLSIMSYNS